ncbi:hypothetical protein [Streptomyces rugosispiralis]|uniref:Uncharacterized protein n=1 Tax=Streptomyces rugosispiralis TaxID=2967341 RepID=A0ABT1VBA1_9ACTN|nr:hypothetical protein [Streptomyces rugosispiralis]MCQ8194672.1 hypothetical protein [Streptomyces rugosispiralis]
MKTTTHFTAERITALLATTVAVLAGLLAARVGAGIGNIAALAFLGYVLTIVVIAAKRPLHLSKVITATGKGALICAVLTVIVLLGIARSFKGLV